MSKTWTAYQHITPNGKIYFGMTCQTPKARWDRGRGYRNQVFGKAIKKYGWDNIEHIILAQDECKHMIENLEEYLIFQFDTTNRENGYNISIGGCGTASGYKHTAKAIELMRINNTGEKNPMFGHKYSDEERENISKQRKERKTYVGEKNGSSKLTEEDVIYCRKNYKFKDREFSYAGLGRKFGVTEGTIKLAVIGETWKHIGDGN